VYCKASWLGRLPYHIISAFTQTGAISHISPPSHIIQSFPSIRSHTSLPSTSSPSRGLGGKCDPGGLIRPCSKGYGTLNTDGGCLSVTSSVCDCGCMEVHPPMRNDAPSGCSVHPTKISPSPGPEMEGKVDEEGWSYTGRLVSWSW
jgi:hypothetical protein